MTDQDEATQEETPEPEEDTHFLDRDLGGRPVIVYLALLAGAAVLSILLLIVWVSSRDGGSSDPVLCLDISIADAERAVLDGEVERIDVLIDEQDPLDGLTKIQLEMLEEDCRSLPEGADNRANLYQLLGVVSLYNEESDERVQVEWQRRSVPAELLSTSTPTPTITPIPSETPVPTETNVPTETPISTPTVEPNASASPQASAVVEPVSITGSPSPGAMSSAEASPQARESATPTTDR